MGYENEIRVLRDHINEIDSQLVPLFEARMRAADDVAALKQKFGMPVYDASREAAVIEKALGRLQDASYAESLCRFYQSLMSISRQRQRSRISFPPSAKRIDGAVGYLGLPGSFSYIAAHEAYPDAELKSLSSFQAIFEALKKGEIALAMLPVENTETGSITAVIDLLARYGYFIVAERLLKVTHSLLAPADATLDTITKIYSHPEPIGQCSQFLADHPHIAAFPALSTAQAAQDVARLNDITVGCIASAEAASLYGLTELAAGIQNSEGNSTRFVVVATQPIVNAACDKTSIVFMVEHRPGSLHDALQLFSDGGVNIHKLESRPLKDRPFEYLFHLDFEGSVADPHVAAVLDSVREKSAELTWLGSYPRMAQ
jgi:chorismate mutase/prephenate dehydratase